MGVTRRCLTGLLLSAVLAGLGVAPAAATASHGRGTVSDGRAASPGPCAEAQAFESLGRLTAAEATYLHELASPTSLPCATAGLKRLGGLDRSCAYADALARNGQRDAASTAYLRVLTVDASSHCASGGLKATAPPSTTSIWTTFGDAAKDAGYAIGAVLLGLLTLVVVILLLLQLQTRAPGLRNLWPANKIRRPVFMVESLSDDATEKFGSAVAGLIRGRVTWRTDRFGLNLVSGQAGVASAFSGLGDVSSEAKAAVAVISFLTASLPRRRFQLTGQLQPAGAEGVGMSLALSQNGDAVALVSLWAGSFDVCNEAPASAYQHLAVAAAAWADIWMTKIVGDDGLLTKDPTSWAFFRSGVDAQRLGKSKRAAALYEQALAADGTNIGAMANLGILLRRAHRYQEAEEYLKRCLPGTEDANAAPNLQPEDNPDWYRIKYQFAALYTNWATETEAGSQQVQRAKLATDEARELAISTLGAISRLSKRGPRRHDAPKEYLRATLRPFLVGTIEPSVLALFAGAVSPLPPRPAKPAPTQRPRRKELMTAIKSGEIDPWDLIDYVEKGSSRPPATLFNLACFYTRAGDFSLAAKRVLGAVRETQRQERKSLVDVITTDPVLKPLLAKRPGIEGKLYEMLDADPVPNADDLRDHFDRQERTISHFQSQGWDVAWELGAKGFELTASKGDQHVLVRLLGLEPPKDTLDSVFALLDDLRRKHPELTNAKASVVAGPGARYAAEDLVTASDRGVEVLRDTGTGLEPIAANHEATAEHDGPVAAAV